MQTAHLLENSLNVDETEGLGIDGIITMKQMSCAGNGSMEMYFKTLTGTMVTLFLDPNDTIQKIKFLIQSAEGIPPEQQRLIFAKNNWKMYGL